MDAAPADTLTETLAAFARERCGALRVEVEWLGVDPARLAAGGRAAWEGDPCRRHPELALWWTVDGERHRWTVRPELVVWVPARLAAAPVPAGAEVVAVDGAARLDALSGGPWTGGAALAVRPLAAGEPLTAANVRARADAASGRAVVLRVRQGSLEIRTDGRLLEDGFVGRPVRAWVAATDAVVSGVLSDADTVDL